MSEAKKCPDCIDWKNQLESERQLREQMKFDADQLRAELEAAREDIEFLKDESTKRMKANLALGEKINECKQLETENAALKNWKSRKQRTRRPRMRIKELEKPIGLYQSLLESIAIILGKSDDLPCSPDEFSWEDMPELIAEILGIEYDRETDGYLGYDDEDKDQ